MSRAAAGGAAALGTPGSRSSAITEEPGDFGHMDGRERRWALRRKARQYVDMTDVPVYAKDEDGNIAYAADGEPVIRRYVAAGDKYLACGERRRDGNAGVGVKWDGPGTRAGLDNLQSCGSVWACPVCAAQIQRERAEELRRVLAFAQDNGYVIAMVTLTLQHYQRDGLADLWDATGTGWSGVTSGSQWASEDPDRYLERKARWQENYRTAREWGTRMPRGGRKFQDLMRAGRFREARAVLPRRRVGDQERYAIGGWTRVVEVTDGRHGWHPHVHAVLVFKGDRDAAELNAIVAGERIFQRWSAALAAEGYVSDRDRGGYHLSIGEQAEAHLIEYMQKDQDTDARDPFTADAMAREVAMGAWKSGHRKGRTPFQTLALIDYDAAPEHSPRMEARWREFVAVSEGRRQQTWSQGFRALLGLEEQARTDEEIAAEDRGGMVRLVVDGDAWDQGVEQFATTICDVIEVEGVDGLRSWLDRAGIPYEMPKLQAQDDWFTDDDPQTDADPQTSATLWD
jgi:hypothetical protein